MGIKTVKYNSYLVLIAISLLASCVSNDVSAPKLVEYSPKFSEVYPSSEPLVAKLLNTYRKQGSLSKLKNDPDRYARNIISWQMEHGGFGLHDASLYHDKWDGVKKRSVWMSKSRELGYFDDNATVAEVRFLAEAYFEITDPSLKNEIKHSVERCLEFIFTAQYDNGGWPQVYPKRFNRQYSNNVTLNDNAMIRIIVLLSDILANISPFDTDLVTAKTKDRIYSRLENAVAYFLKTQIKNNNELTIWSSQYDPESNLPAPARSYELVSKSGRESVGVLAYLMNWPEQSEELVAAVSGGVAWYDSNKIENMVLEKGVFSQKNGTGFWYRFYEVDSNVPFFSGRDGIKKYDLAQVERERRIGYSWGDDYASKILRAAPHYFSGDEL